MSGYGPFDDLTLFAVALAIILSAIVSLIGTSARKRNIALGQARVGDLAEMTGISDPKELLETFGPPDMNRVWRSVTLLDVRRARQPMGWLMSSDLVDYACLALVGVSIFFAHPLINGALLFALAIQVAGWIVATRLPR